MKKIFIYSLIYLGFAFSSCAQSPGKQLPVVEPAVALKDIMSLVNYESKYMKLTESFNAYTEDGEPITKLQFLKIYSTGAYLPVRINSKDDKPAYRLYALQKTINKDYLKTLKALGTKEYRRYQKEGTAFPPFNFIDLNGKVFNNAMMKGKIVVLKSWFIKCGPCQAEMPELNKVAEQYKNRKDIIFVSLALDSAKALKAFLKKTKFNYAVISDPDDYMDKQFLESASPTHLLVDKQGKITLITNNSHVLIKDLHTEAAKL